MKILFVSNRYPTIENPGDSPCIAQQRQALERFGYEIDLLYIDSQKSKLNYLKSVWLIFWKIQVCRQYDIVHAHYGQYCGLVACLQFTRPTIITFRGSDILYHRELPISRWAARLASHLIVMSQQMKTVLGQESAEVIPYGIDLERFRPLARDESRLKLSLSSDAPILLFPYDPARKIKRYSLATAAVEILKLEFPNIELIAIHDRPYEDIPLYMNACDVLVMTSQSEGAPVAVREAMACNLPIVSVDVGDVASVIGTTDNCAIVDTEPEVIANSIAEILRTGKRSNGRNSATEMSVRTFAQSVANIYEQVGTRKKPVELKSKITTFPAETKN